MCFYVCDVCVCTCIYAWGCSDICMNMWVEARSHDRLPLFIVLYLVLLRQDSLLNLELTDWLGWQRSKLHHVRVLPHSAFVWVPGIWIWVFVFVWHIFYQLCHYPSMWNFQFSKFGGWLIMGKQCHRKQNQREREQLYHKRTKDSEPGEGGPVSTALIFIWLA